MTLTNHAKQRMQQRKINLEDVHNCICQGVTSEANNNCIRYTYNNICVIIDRDNHIVTVTYTSKYNKLLSKHSKKHNITISNLLNLVKNGVLTIC